MKVVKNKWFDINVDNNIVVALCNGEIYILRTCNKLMCVNRCWFDHLSSDGVLLLGSYSSKVACIRAAINPDKVKGVRVFILKDNDEFKHWLRHFISSNDPTAYGREIPTMIPDAISINEVTGKHITVVENSKEYYLLRKLPSGFYSFIRMEEGPDNLQKCLLNMPSQATVGQTIREVFLIGGAVYTFENRQEFREWLAGDIMSKAKGGLTDEGSC
ncbi:MAG: hypothetical protein GY861_22100 [bacterium]|nr:hypothetical protein [bacterium]